MQGAMQVIKKISGHQDGTEKHSRASAGLRQARPRLS